jgi:hypothetical protein
MNPLNLAETRASLLVKALTVFYLEAEGTR